MGQPTPAAKQRYRNSEKGRLKAALYRAEHKEEIAEKGRRFRQEHKEEVKERKRLYAQENAAKIAEYQREYQRKNRTSIRVNKAEYRESHREDIARWSKKYFTTEKGRAYCLNMAHKRRARLANTPPDRMMTRGDLISIRQEYTSCAYCLAPLPVGKREIDHVTALSRGGEHVPENIVICCRSCNSAKGNRGLIQWLQRCTPCGPS